MSSRTIALLLLTLTLFAAGAARAHAQLAEKPNILLFMADDMTYHDSGAYGNTQVRTPNIDRLASEGLRFEYCYNSSPMCAPTRMSLYTGIHPVRNGAWPNHSYVYDDVVSLPQLLRPLGYEVALMGKRHILPDANFPFVQLPGRGHDGGDGKALDLDEVGRFMREMGDNPWCLVIANNQPHTPWNRGDASAYDADALTVPPYLVDTPAIREGLTRYYAEITYMDAQLGEALQQLEAAGQTDNTLVLFLSEQGSQFPYCKWTCYETGLRSQAIIRWPRSIRPDALSSEMIQYVDFAPTFVELAGGNPADHDFDGTSLTPLLRGRDEPLHEHIFGLQTSRGIYDGPEAYGIRTVRDDRYRLIWNLNWRNDFSNVVTANSRRFHEWQQMAGPDHPFAAERARGYVQRPEFELYDLKNDPWAFTNLAGDPAHEARLQQLKAALDAWMRQQGDEGVATEMAARERQRDNM